MFVLSVDINVQCWPRGPQKKKKKKKPLNASLLCLWCARLWCYFLIYLLRNNSQLNLFHSICAHLEGEKTSTPQKRIEKGCFTYVTRLKLHWGQIIKPPVTHSDHIKKTVNVPTCVPQKKGHWKFFFRCQERVDKWCRKAQGWISMYKHICN